jgi:hypothetical protein
MWRFRFSPARQLVGRAAGLLGTFLAMRWRSSGALIMATAPA